MASWPKVQATVTGSVAGWTKRRGRLQPQPPLLPHVPVHRPARHPVHGQIRDLPAAAPAARVPARGGLQPGRSQRIPPGFRRSQDSAGLPDRRSLPSSPWPRSCSSASSRCADQGFLGVRTSPAITMPASLPRRVPRAPGSYAEGMRRPGLLLAADHDGGTHRGRAGPAAMPCPAIAQATVWPSPWRPVTRPRSARVHLKACQDGTCQEADLELMPGSACLDQGCTTGRRLLRNGLAGRHQGGKADAGCPDRVGHDRHSLRDRRGRRRPARPHPGVPAPGGVSVRGAVRQVPLGVRDPGCGGLAARGS